MPPQCFGVFAAILAAILGRRRPTPQPQPTPPPAPRPTPPPVPAGLAMAMEMRDAEMFARNWADLTGLAIHPCLVAAAAAHAVELAGRNRLDHLGRDGSDHARRIARAGLSGVPTGENLAAGQATPAAVVSAWLDDPPHREILLGEWTHCGAGWARSSTGVPYWVSLYAQIGRL